MSITKYDTLTPHQKNVYDQIINVIDDRAKSVLRTTRIEDYLLSLTGAAGTGKTYLTTHIAKYLLERDSQDYAFVVTAPTHKAVSVLSNMFLENKMQVSCKTIHSFLGIKPFRDYKTGEEKFTIDKTKKSKETTAILIVDESSMIGVELYEYILEAIESGQVGMVLFIGDEHQLLPIGCTSNSIYTLPLRYELNEIVRQAKESGIIQVATALRTCIETKQYGDISKLISKYKGCFSEIQYFHNSEIFLEDFYANAQWYEEDKILATPTNKNVDSINKIVRKQYWHEKGKSNIPMLLAGDSLRFNQAYSVRDITMYHNGQTIKLDKAELHHHETLGIDYWECKAANVPQQQVFRVVDTDSVKNFNNILRGIIKKAKQSKFPEKQKMWKAYYQVRDMFADVQYSYASTIHKLQGSTYETVYIDLFSLLHNDYMSNDEKYRLVYVALTRASKHVKLLVSLDTSSSTSTDDTFENFNTLEKFDQADLFLKEILS